MSRTVKTIANPENFRNNIRDNIESKLKNKNSSINLEIGIYNYTIKKADRHKIVKNGTIHHLFKFI